MSHRLLLLAALTLLLAAPAAVVFAIRDGDAAPAPGVRVAEVRIAGAPTDIALAQGRAWVPTAGDGRLTAIDGGDAPSVARPTRPARARCASASDGVAIWVAGATGNSLTAVDPLFGRQGRAARSRTGATPSTWPGRDGVWVSNGASGTVTRIDPVCGRTVGEPVRTGRFPTALAVGERDLWVVNSGDGTLARIDPREKLVVGRRVPVGRDPQDVAIGFGSVWVANRGDGTLSRVDEGSGRPQGTCGSAGRRRRWR